MVSIEEDVPMCNLYRMCTYVNSKVAVKDTEDRVFSKLHLVSARHGERSF